MTQNFCKVNRLVTLNYTSKWTREDYDRPTYMTGLFFHNIARRWPTCPVRDPNGHYQQKMEIIEMEDGGKPNQPEKLVYPTIAGHLRTHKRLAYRSRRQYAYLYTQTIMGCASYLRL